MAHIKETFERVLVSEEGDVSCEISCDDIAFHQKPSGCVLWPFSEIDDLIKFLQEEKERLAGQDRDPKQTT